MNAKSVDICVFTNIPPNGGYGHDVIAQPERGMYAAVSDAASQLFQQESIEGTTVALCYAKDPNAQAFLKQTTAQPPFIAIAGTFPDGSMKLYALKSTNQVKDYIRAMWLGEFGGTTPMPTNLGDGDGGWGTGKSLVCKLIPPLCALGFLPWLALAAVATYKTAESRSTTGKAMWGVPAGLLWLGFFERGGVKQIQWWMKKAGIGSINEMIFKSTSGKKEVRIRFNQNQGYVARYVEVFHNGIEPETRLIELKFFQTFTGAEKWAKKIL